MKKSIFFSIWIGFSGCSGALWAAKQPIRIESDSQLEIPSLKSIYFEHYNKGQDSGKLSYTVLRPVQVLYQMRLVEVFRKHIFWTHQKKLDMTPKHVLRCEDIHAVITLEYKKDGCVLYREKKDGDPQALEAYLKLVKGSWAGFLQDDVIELVETKSSWRRRAQHVKEELLSELFLRAESKGWKEAAPTLLKKGKASWKPSRGVAHASGRFLDFNRADILSWKVGVMKLSGTRDGLSEVSPGAFMRLRLKS